MSVRAIIGAQFGDEAKGKIADYLAEGAKYVVRAGGGPNAGHSIHLAEGNLVLHQLSCGVLRTDVTGISGPGMIIDPIGLESEMGDLDRRGLLKGRVVLSDRAQVILPHHRAEDAWEEKLRSEHPGSDPVGTTLRGIGPAYADRAGRWGLRMADLTRPGGLGAKLELAYARKRHLTGLPSVEELTATLTEVGGRLAPLIQPTEPILWEAIDRGEPILLEGAQSVLLDLDFGMYPYVTSSHPTAAGALVGSGIPPQELDEVIGVTKAYATRVGSGPFPTEVEGEMAEFLQKEGNERGATTGRVRRCGWLDLVLLRYAAKLSGFTSWAVTKVDVLGGLDEVPVCTAYQGKDGVRRSGYPPTFAEDFQDLSPVYERFPGWPVFNSHLKERLHREGAHALPSTLRRFLSNLSESTGIPVEYVSYGPLREETLWLGRGARGVPVSALAGWSG